ncbi:MAG: DUF4198 domain-containing protein [Fretibacterium sp.]|nr:DUF4198 domain-containing protein [Fretibacterium sp.]
MKKRIVLLSLLATFCAAPAFAHFQMLYTPETIYDKSEEVPLKLVFTHPFEAGHTMNMGKPLEFFVVNKEKKTDLMDTLKPIVWAGLENKGKGYETSYKLKGMGDYVFCLVPAPYLEKSEDAYIQQITKMIVNNGSLPTDWDSDIGLKAEITPLDKPYALWTGNVFRGVVKCEGKPVPGAEIEVEFLNHKPDMKKNAFDKKPMAEAPHDAFVTMTIKADEQGVFTFGIPKAGWWGFAALGVGPDTEYQGKELSQDAVIWVQAIDM